MGAAPRARSRAPSSSARTTERWRPPVHPRAMVRYDFPSSSKAGQGEPDEVVDPVEEGAGGLLAEHEVAHGGVEARQRAQLLDPVRVGQEAAVEDEVGVEGHAVLVPEGHHRRAHARLRLVAEQLGDPLAQLVDVQLAGVDDDVGPGPHRLEESALVDDGLGHLALGDGMAAPGALEPAHQDVLGGVEVDELDPVALGPQGVDGGKGLFHPGPPAPADHQGDAVLDGPGPAHHGGHLAQQRRGHVVDHVPAGVLEGGRRGRPPRPGHAGDDQIVAQLPVLTVRAVPGRPRPRAQAHSHPGGAPRATA